MWLVTLGECRNRAFMASGCAAAAAAKGIRVTLAEIGGGLPNIGYYLSLDPSEYAAPGIDPSRFLEGSIGDNLRFVSCSGIEALERYDPGVAEDDIPHLLLIAFDGGVLPGTAADMGRIWMPDHGDGPDALCVFGDPALRSETRVLFDQARKGNKEAFLLELVEGDSPGDADDAGAGEGADEIFAVPERLVSSWRRRSTPDDRFFDDLITNVLQVLSHRRRRAERYA